MWSQNLLNGYLQSHTNPIVDFSEKMKKVDYRK